MYTLLGISVIYTIIGWSLQFRDVKRGKLESIDPFKKPPTARTVPLFFTSIISAIAALYLALKYLP
jgi:hypothetical protein